jgi:glycosyltransferase involved in cell wall biosynthesis
MASGVPVVSSPVGVNRELIMRSGGGYLADTPDEWEDALRSLAADPDLRAEMGRKGRAFVEGYADLRTQSSRLAQLLTGASHQPVA